jgi:hypothetical protein
MSLLLTLVLGGAVADPLRELTRLMVNEGAEAAACKRGVVCTSDVDNWDNTGSTDAIETPG